MHSDCDASFLYLSLLPWVGNPRDQQGPIYSSSWVAITNKFPTISLDKFKCNIILQEHCNKSKSTYLQMPEHNILSYNSI